MPYHLTLARTSVTDPSNAKIGVHEWIAAVAADPDLRRDLATEPPDRLTAFYCAPEDLGGLPATFSYLDGRVSCKNPDEPALAKLLSLAHQLGAQVHGEDGEIYHAPDELPEFPAAGLFEKPSPRLRIRWPGKAAPEPQTAPALAQTAPVPAAPAEPAPPRRKRKRKADSTAEAPPEPAPAPAQTPVAPETHAPAATITVPKPRWKMAVGFPTGTREPSPALRALLQPVRPVTAPESAAV